MNYYEVLYLVHTFSHYNVCCMFLYCKLKSFLSLILANVRKWEKSMETDERELEKLKKEEGKHMKVCEKVHNNNCLCMVTIVLQ